MCTYVCAHFAGISAAFECILASPAPTPTPTPARVVHLVPGETILQAYRYRAHSCHEMHQLFKIFSIPCRRHVSTSQSQQPAAPRHAGLCKQMLVRGGLSGNICSECYVISAEF